MLTTNKVAVSGHLNEDKNSIPKLTVCILLKQASSLYRYFKVLFSPVWRRLKCYNPFKIGGKRPFGSKLCFQE